MKAPRSGFRFRTAAEGVALTATMWAVLLLIAVTHHGTFWPQAIPPVPPREGFPGRPGFSRFEAWENFALLCLIVEFLLLKCYAMARRTRRLDGLGATLIAANLAFAVVYLYALGQMLYGWQSSAWDRRLILRYPLVIVLIVGVVYLCAIPDEPREREEEDLAARNRALEEENRALRAALGMASA